MCRVGITKTRNGKLAEACAANPERFVAVDHP